jgi:sugar lactone lactonase YvrE
MCRVRKEANLAGNVGRVRAGVSVIAVCAAWLTLGSTNAWGFGFIKAWDSPAESITVDAAGNVYTAGLRSSGFQVHKYTSEGDLLTEWGPEGSGPGQFTWSAAIAVDPAGNVYVGDTSGMRVQKFTPDGVYISEWGSQGNGDGQFNGVGGMATDAAGNVYVTDPITHRVQKFTSDGVFITEWGTPVGQPDGPGELSFPQEVEVDAAGNVYIADNGNKRIQKFTSDGVYLQEWGGEGTGPGQFTSTYALAADPFGNLYAGDGDAVEVGRVMKFTTGGQFLESFGEIGIEDDQFYGASEGMATDSAGNLYIQDNARVKKYGEVPPPVSGETVNLDPLKGKVSTKCKGERKFTPLQVEEQIDVGCQVDTTKGEVELVSATGKGEKTQSADYSDGTFKVQQKQGKAEVTLTLTGKLSCKADGIAARGKRGGRGLFGSGNAQTTTRGNNGAGTVRGKAAYYIGDTCDGTTEVQVKKGTVKFEDFVSDRTVTVKAGDSYETEPR